MKGIAGMMKFGKHDAPVLLEALGVLLVHREYDIDHDAKQLAARAFLRASYEVPEESVRVPYRRMAARAVAQQLPPQGVQREGDDMLARVERDFQKELEEGRAWYADLRERELSWIRDGKDPEVEFDTLYEAEPEVSGMDVRDPLLSVRDRQKIAAVAVAVFVGAISLAVVLGAVACVVIVVRMKWRDWSDRPEPNRV